MILYWEDGQGGSGNTAVPGDKEEAMAHWKKYFEPHGFKLIELGQAYVIRRVPRVSASAS